MNFYKILTTFIIIVLINGACSLEKGCRMNVLDTKLKNVLKFVASLDHKFPKNENEYATYCKQMRADVTDSRNYMKKCTKDVAKTLLSVTLHSVEKMTVKSQCKLRTEKRRFLSFSNCGNTGHKEIAKCWQNNTKRITAININGTKSNTKIPLMCCSLIQWKNCVLASLSNKPDNVCSVKDLEYIEQFIEKGMLDPMNMVCAEYDDSDKCDKILKQLPKIDSIKLKYSTLFPAIVEMFESL